MTHGKVISNVRTDVLSSGKIICRTAAVSVAIELCKEEMILLIPPENM